MTFKWCYRREMYSLLVRGGVVVCFLAVLVDVNALTGGSRDGARSLLATQKHERIQTPSKTKRTLPSSSVKWHHRNNHRVGHDHITAKRTVQSPRTHESYRKYDDDIRNFVHPLSASMELSRTTVDPPNNHKRDLQQSSRESECIFPFIYNGETTYGCVKDESTGNRRWCSLTNNYDRDTLWTHCSQQDNATKRLSTPHMKVVLRKGGARAKALSPIARALSRGVSTQVIADANARALQRAKTRIHLPNSVYSPKKGRFSAIDVVRRPRPKVVKLLMKTRPSSFSVICRVKPNSNSVISNSRADTFTKMLNKMDKMSRESLSKISGLDPFGRKIEIEGSGKSLSGSSSLFSKPIPSLKKVGDLTNRLVQTVKGLTASVPLKTEISGDTSLTFKKLDTSKKPYTILQVGNGQNDSPQGVDTQTQRQKQRIISDAKNVNIIIINNDKNGDINLNDIEKSIAESTGAENEAATEGKDRLSADQSPSTEGKDRLSADQSPSTEGKDRLSADKSPSTEGKDRLSADQSPSTEGKNDATVEEKEALSIDENPIAEEKDLSMDERLKTNEKDVMDKGPLVDGKDLHGTAENPQTEGKDPGTEGKDIQNANDRPPTGENFLQGANNKPDTEGKTLFATDEKLETEEKDGLSTNANPKLEGKDTPSIEAKVMTNETEATEDKPIVEGKEVTTETQMMTNDKSLGSKTEGESSSIRPFPLHIPNDKNNLDSNIGTTITYHGDKELTGTLNSLENPTGVGSDSNKDEDIHMLHAVNEGAKENDNNDNSSSFGKERYTTFGATLPQKVVPSMAQEQAKIAEESKKVEPITVSWSEDKGKKIFDVDFSSMAFTQKGVSRNKTIGSSKGRHQERGNKTNKKVQTKENSGEKGQSGVNDGYGVDDNTSAEENNRNLTEQGLSQVPHYLSTQQVDITNEPTPETGNVSTADVSAADVSTSDVSAADASTPDVSAADVSTNEVSTYLPNNANTMVVDSAVPSVESAANSTSRKNTSAPTEDVSEMTSPYESNTIMSPETNGISIMTSQQEASSPETETKVNPERSEASKLQEQDLNTAQTDTGEVNIPHYVSSNNYEKEVEHYATAAAPGNQPVGTGPELDSGKNANENSPPLTVLNGADGTEEPSVSVYEEQSARGAHSALNQSVSAILNSTSSLSNTSLSQDDTKDKVKIETIEKKPEDAKKDKERDNAKEEKQGSEATKEKEVSGNKEQKQSSTDSTNGKGAAIQPSELAKATNNDHQRVTSSTEQIYTPDVAKANSGNDGQKTGDSVPGTPVPDASKENSAVNPIQGDKSKPSVSAKHTNKVISFTPYNDLELNDDDNNEMNPVNSTSSETGTSLVDETGLPLDNGNPTGIDETTSPLSIYQNPAPAVNIDNSDQSKTVARNDTNGQIGRTGTDFQENKLLMPSLKGNDSSSYRNTTLSFKDGRKEQDYGDTNIAKVLSDISSTLNQSSKEPPLFTWDMTAGTANDNPNNNVASEAGANTTAAKESNLNAEKNATTTNTNGISDSGQNPAFMTLDDTTSPLTVASDKDITELSPALLKPGLPATHMNGQVNMSYAPEELVVLTWGGNGNGAKCNFPFIYNGETYFNCITLNRDKPWCSTTASYDRTPIWGYCDQESQNLPGKYEVNKKNDTVKATGEINSGLIVKDSEDLGSINTFGGNGLGRRCVLPFIYDGEVHAQCIPKSDGLTWCAVTHSYDVTPMWGNCCDGAQYKC